MNLLLFEEENSSKKSRKIYPWDWRCDFSTTSSTDLKKGDLIEVRGGWLIYFLCETATQQQRGPNIGWRWNHL